MSYHICRSSSRRAHRIWLLQCGRPIQNTSSDKSQFGYHYRTDTATSLLKCWRWLPGPIPVYRLHSSPCVSDVWVTLSESSDSGHIQSSFFPPHHHVPCMVPLRGQWETPTGLLRHDWKWQRWRYDDDDDRRQQSNEKWSSTGRPGRSWRSVSEGWGGGVGEVNKHA